MRRTSLLILSGLLISQTGCGTALKRTWTELKGAEARAKGVTGAAPSGLARFRGVRIMPVRTHLAGLVDTTYKATLPSALKARLTRRDDDHKPVFPGGSPVLTLDPEITFYSEPGAVGGLFGSDAYAVVLFWLKADAADIGRIQVVSKSGASRTGPDDLAQATAKGLAHYLRKHRRQN